MIDEKKLIEFIEKRKMHMIPDPYGYHPVTVENVLNLLNKFPKINQWIPCSERLPNTNGVYNITRKLAEGECKFYISDSAYFDGQDTWHADNRVNHGREYLKDVVAWSELPEPYKGVD